MTYFHVNVTLTCPSDWTAVRVQKYIERFVLTQEERDTLCVTPGHSRPAAEPFLEALRRIRSIHKAFPFDSAAAATECIRIARQALGEKS